MTSHQVGSGTEARARIDRPSPLQCRHGRYFRKRNPEMTIFPFFFPSPYTQVLLEECSYSRYCRISFRTWNETPGGVDWTKRMAFLLRHRSPAVDDHRRHRRRRLCAKLNCHAGAKTCRYPCVLVVRNKDTSQGITPEPNWPFDLFIFPYVIQTFFLISFAFRLPDIFGTRRHRRCRHRFYSRTTLVVCARQSISLSSSSFT